MTSELAKILIFCHSQKNIHSLDLVKPTKSTPRRVELAAAKHWRWVPKYRDGSAVNSLSFAFTNLFLPKYHVKYDDYIVKWCSGI